MRKERKLQNPEWGGEEDAFEGKRKETGSVSVKDNSEQY